MSCDQPYATSILVCLCLSSAMFGKQLRLHDLNIATSVEVVDHTNVKCYNFFGVTTLHGTGLAEMKLSMVTVLVSAGGAEEFVFKNWFDFGMRLPMTSSAIEFVSFDGLCIQGELG